MNGWSLEDFQQSLEKLGISSGSKVFIHSNLAFLGTCTSDRGDFAGSILDTLEITVSRKGAIYLPAFTYTFGDDKIFNPNEETGISKMGTLSLASFKKGHARSNDPMFSVLGFGDIWDNFHDYPSNSSFGPNSLFGELVNQDIRLLLIGTGGGTTLLHEVERRLGVDYRFDKTFTCQIYSEEDQEIRKLDWNAYVRDLSSENSLADFRRLTIDLVRESIAYKVKLGKSYLLSYSIAEVSDFVKEKLKSEPFYLTLKGWKTLEH